MFDLKQNFFILVTILTTLAYSSNAAPTQKHLSIAAKGDTPTLVVTSAQNDVVTPTIPSTSLSYTTRSIDASTKLKDGERKGATHEENTSTLAALQTTAASFTSTSHVEENVSPTLTDRNFEYTTNGAAEKQQPSTVHVVGEQYSAVTPDILRNSDNINRFSETSNNPIPTTVFTVTSESPHDVLIATTKTEQKIAHTVSDLEYPKIEAISTSAVKSATTIIRDTPIVATTQAITSIDNADNRRAPITVAAESLTVFKNQPKVALKKITPNMTKNHSSGLSIFAGNLQNIDAYETQQEQPKAQTQQSVKVNKLIDFEETPNEQHDEVVRLIDLESTGKINKNPSTDSDGHDGLKQTKKKQLLDKHYLTETSTVLQVHAIALKSPKNITAVRHNNNTKTKQTLSTHDAMKRPAAAAASSTWAPIQKSYLGPIFMEETIFNNEHAKNSPQSQHESSIESQLRDGRIVEIIAPTALLEQATQKADEITTSTTTTASTTAKATLSHPIKIEHTPQQPPLLSTTVFQVPDSLTSTTRQPGQQKYAEIRYSTPEHENYQNYAEQTESKISDIQIEVYDSTVNSIVASTNFKDGDAFHSQAQDKAIGTTKPPLSATTQERFTQYVIDRTDSSTQGSYIEPANFSAGKPEPAAIEIHINVSESVVGTENDSESDLHYANEAEFSANNDNKPISQTTFEQNPTNEQTDTNPFGERSDEILVVEIIDTGDNITDTPITPENINRLFNIKNVKYYSQEAIVKPPQLTDELFMADLKKGENGLPQPPMPPPPPPRKSIDRDSDTIFYISNTEVKVGESLPTANIEAEQQQEQLRKDKLESRFFPANYVASTISAYGPSMGRKDESKPKQHRYEEDIILSHIRNNGDSLKIFRSQNDGAPPLDVTYVGESVMEVEQSSDVVGAGGGISSVGGSISTTSASYTLLQAPDIIIQPAILPELSIGVPVIGELPPQIELKEIDFMPDEANLQHSSVYENNNNLNINNNNAISNDIEETVSGNDIDRLVESSIQYGGDLIEEGAGGGFDGIEGSYPFGNPVAMQRKAKHNAAADYMHTSLNHGVNNLRRDELNVYIQNSAETEVLDNAENATIKELENKNNTVASMNITYAVAERVSNATAFSDNSADGNENESGLRNFYTLIIGLFVVLLPVVVTVSMACALKYLYSKYQSTSSENIDSTESQPGNGCAQNGGDNGKSATLPSPTKRDLSKDITENDNTAVMPHKPSNSNTLNITNEKCPESKPEVGIINKTTSERVQPTKSIPNSEQINKSVQKYYAGPNGSVTKMTLKNNHLIVETEERNDISRDARETKMHYNNSEKDGIFVVEVARGVDSGNIPESPIAETCEQQLSIGENKRQELLWKPQDEKVLKNHEEVQIHQPPQELQQFNASEDLQRSLHQIEEEDEPTPSPNAAMKHEHENRLTHNSSTGLSQSDLSSSSSTDSNKRYSYGNQELYTIEQHGYSTVTPTAGLPNHAFAHSQEADDDDHKSENGHSLEHSPAQVAASNTDTNNASAKHSEEKLLTNVETQAFTENTETELEIVNNNSSNANPNVVEQLTVENISEIVNDNNNLQQQQVLVTPAASTPSTAQLAENEELSEDGTNNNEQLLVENNNTEIDAEDTLDSIVNLPEPPSTEEIIALNEYNLVEANQTMDSLPPPPPPENIAAPPPETIAAAPATAAAVASDSNGNENATDALITQLKAAATLSNEINGSGNIKQLTVAPAAPIANGKHDEYDSVTQENYFISILPPPMELTSNGKLVTAPLTPPASPTCSPSPPPPPPTPPLTQKQTHHYNSNGLNNGICTPLPITVDVNGS